MKSLPFIIAIAFLLSFGVSTVACQSAAIDAIERSHLDDNVPGAKDFDDYLKRDLQAYFKASTGRRAIVEYELLQNAPAQSGAAYPKFYIWIKVKEKDGLIEEGAVRVAAIEKKRFEVTCFLRRSDIERDPPRIYEAFPKSIADKIIKEFISPENSSL